LQKKEADIALLDDEDDGFKVRISVRDFEVLKKAKVAAQANPNIFAQF
jgi:hypothetical protein